MSFISRLDNLSHIIRKTTSRYKILQLPKKRKAFEENLQVLGQMKLWKKNGPQMVATSDDSADSKRKDSKPNAGQQQRKTIGIRSSPLEAHWHFLELQKKKKKPTLASKMSFRSLQKSLTKITKSGTFRTIFQGVRDPEELKQVQSLRDLLASTGQLPEKHDDYHTLLRFLRMRNFDLAQTRIMFVNMLKWREDNRVDVIAREFEFEEYDAVQQCYPRGYHGVDNVGRPLCIERIGSIDFNTLLNVTTVDRFVKHHIVEQEKTLNLRFPACSLAAKRHIASITAILDVEGLGIKNFSKPAREIFTEIQKIDSNYYPETLNQLYIINAGPGFKALWNILRAFLEPRTLSKVQVLGTSFISKLSEAVDLSNIPEFFGGKCKCVEHGGCLRKDKGPWTDPEIKSKLMEVFYKAQKLEDEPTDENIFKELSKSQVTSDGRLGSNSIATTPKTENYIGIDSLEQYMGTASASKHLAQKISELEEWLVETNEILQTLFAKQQQLADNIEELKNLTEQQLRVSDA
ncbi:phosphatidylinositol/phosphatidylcholine transfer protein SFH11 isoform X2 [Musa acuminata AAA Group]|uniref:phosphatidylinositol/phosphatidylcholine transfer protein SFH11 isoform X2 n=1 Tax=Musa acuminata AAA Group TaxID=214697 RepID=UPI0031DD82AD